MGRRRFHSPQAFFFAGATGRKLHSSNSLGENPLPWLGNIVQRGIRVQSRQVQGELAPERQQPERRWDDRKLPSRGMKCVSPLSASRPFFSLLPPFLPSRRTTLAVSPYQAARQSYPITASVAFRRRATNTPYTNGRTEGRE